MLECLADLDGSLKNIGTKLYVFIGEAVAVFKYLHSKYIIDKLCFEHDSEPIWHARDEAVKSNFVLRLGF
jgi:cryptochrome